MCLVVFNSYFLFCKLTKYNLIFSLYNELCFFEEQSNIDIQHHICLYIYFMEYKWVSNELIDYNSQEGKLISKKYIYSIKS